MEKTIEQETREHFNYIKHLVKKGKEGKIPYISGTLNKRTRMYKIADRYESDAKIDYELGIIAIAEYEIERESVFLLRKAISNMNII